jgi:hypothetical protein
MVLLPTPDGPLITNSRPGWRPFDELRAGLPGVALAKPGGWRGEFDRSFGKYELQLSGSGVGPIFKRPFQ